MSDVINRGMSVVVSVAVVVALFAMVNVPNNPARRLFEALFQMF